MLQFLMGILEQGLIYGIMGIGVYLTYKILDFADLSVEGTFPLGASICASLIFNGVNPFLACIVSFIGGCLAGSITGILNVKFKISGLLSGILVMTGLYSINIRVMMGKPNVVINNTIFSTGVSTLVIMGIFIVVCKILIDYFLSTKLGYALKVTGDNPQLVTSLGVNIGLVKIIGVALANGFVALSGAILAQSQSFSDVGMGSGVIVIALGSIIIGTSIFKKVDILKPTTKVIIGTIIYRGVIAFALSRGLPASDVKIASAIVLIVILALNKYEFKIPKKIKDADFVKESKKVGEARNVKVGQHI